MQQALDEAWVSGLRYFDTFALYGSGLSETHLNRFLRNKSRNEYILSLKVGGLMKPFEARE